MKNTHQQRFAAVRGGATESGEISGSQPGSRWFRGGWRLGAAATVLGLAASHAIAGELNLDFTTDPTGQVEIGGNNPDYYVSAGGNPGGFLAITWPIGSQKTTVIFPNLDPGKIVTGFDLSCDLRVGNSTGDRAADGFSISFARDGDPILADKESDQFGGNCCAETGTKTGIAVSFDTWSGNVFPNDPADTTDIEGIIVRVDDRTISKTSLPTRHGAADDNTSLQTGPRDAAYWTGGGDPKAPESWATLAWRPFQVILTDDAKLTVSWKGRKVLDAFQTTYFPSAGQLVFSGRTGGANEHTHVDNLKLKTTAASVTVVPGATPNFKAAEIGARRVKLTWDAAPISGQNQVAYELVRDGVVIAPLLTAREYVDRGVAPGKAYAYKILAKNIAGNAGPEVNLNVNTTTEVDGVGFLRAEQWLGIGSTSVDAGLGDAHFADPPDRVRYVNGLSFGETTNFGDTWGDNHLVKISGVLTAPKSGNFHFHVRSDDASRFILNTEGAAIPDPNSTGIAEETGCCTAFFAQGSGDESVSAEIALVKGNRYGFVYLVKEGGGGDWGQVGISEAGSSDIILLRGAILGDKVDPAGATVAITTQPTSQSVGANSPVTFSVAATGSSPYGADYGNALSYQWYVDGAAVLGANSASYTIPFAPTALSGKKVWVVVAVAGANVKSDEVTLTVSADTTAPVPAAIAGSETFDKVTIRWAEPVVDPSATTASNYQITGLTVNSVTRVDQTTVVLSTSKQTVGSVYPITINGVRDTANLASAFNGELYAFILKKGIVTFRTWENQGGGFGTWIDNGVRDLNPTRDETRTSYNSGTGIADNYFGQLKGYFFPATTADYVFWIAGDDHSELYLSTDADPANKKKIAEEPSWSDNQVWNGDGSASNTGTRGEVGARANRSDEYQGTEWATGAGGAIRLTAGQQYYLEVLYKEGGGGDHGAATFKLATAADPANGSTALTGDLIGTYVNPLTLPPLITKRPTSVAFNRGDKIEFKVEYDSSGPTTVQWYQNKKAIAGATGSTLTINNADVANIGDYMAVVTNPNGSASTYPDNDARATMKGVAMVIELEDYNHGGGKTVAAASVNPLVSDLYKGLDGLPEIDFHNGSPSGGSDAENGNSLRNGWVDNGTTMPSPAGAGGNLDVIIDNGNGGAGENNVVRPDFTLANNYKIGWGGTGNWWNYTRNFEPGSYNVVWGGSRDGRDNNIMSRTLEIVTGDITQPNQTTTVVGEFTANGTGAWSSNDLIPFLTPGGTSVANVTLGANTTLRVRISAGDGDNDFLLVYKSGSTPPPNITSIVRNANGSVTISWTGGGTLEAANSVNGPWQAVPGATSPFTFNPDQAQQFGRIRVP